MKDKEIKKEEIGTMEDTVRSIVHTLCRLKDCHSVGQFASEIQSERISEQLHVNTNYQILRATTTRYQDIRMESPRNLPVRSDLSFHSLPIFQSPCLPMSPPRPQNPKRTSTEHGGKKLPSTKSTLPHSKTATPTE